jgi:isoleucyl-tRNA synthetase
MRKSSGLEVTDRINVTYSGDAEVKDAMEEFADYVCTETLAESLDSAADPGEGGEDWDLNGHSCRIRVEESRNGTK